MRNCFLPCEAVWSLRETPLANPSLFQEKKKIEKAIAPNGGILSLEGSNFTSGVLWVGQKVYLGFSKRGIWPTQYLNFKKQTSC